MIGQKNQVYYHKLNLPTRKLQHHRCHNYLSSTLHCRFALKHLSTHVVVSLISQKRLIKLTGKRYGKLKQCNISSTFLNLIKNMYSQLKCQVKTIEWVSECFSQDNRVLQGESLSPTIFTAYIIEFESRMNAIEGMGVDQELVENHRP